jgi:crotonobetainyl-CoA:carnitine CoA-transferase CaiB-like acyl-CoA transferase
MGGPLDGIRVVDLSIMAAGPWAGVLLGELGAEVIKIEPPSGDGTRWVRPYQRGVGTNFIAMNVGKRDIVLDLKEPSDRDFGLSLVASADVFVQNLTGGVMERLGFGYERIHTLNPRLVYCSINGFGSLGPLARERCSDTIMQAFSGFARLNGAAPGDLEQFRFSGLLDLVSASVAVNGVLGALLQRQITGRGQHVDVSMLEAGLEIQYTRFAEYLAGAEVVGPLGSASSSFAPDQAFEALDEPVFITVRSDREWRALCVAIEREDLLTDPRFANNAGRVAHRDELASIVGEIVGRRPAFWWDRSFRRAGVPVGLSTSLANLRHHQQAVENRMLAEVDTPWGTTCVGGLPWHFSLSPGRIAPPPEPDADGEAIRARGFDVDQSERFSDDFVDAGKELPLSGALVVELSSGPAGGLAALRLGDLGARVVKVEAERDWLRGAVPSAQGSSDAVAFLSLTTGKELLELDVDADWEQLAELLLSADVVISDWEQHGIGGDRYQAFVERADRGDVDAVWIELSDFGSLGPFAGHAGSELAAQAIAGYTDWLGTTDAAPLRLGADVASCGAGIHAVAAALAGLYWRRLGNSGQTVRLSLLNSLASLASIHHAAQSDPDDYRGPRVGGMYFPRKCGWKTKTRPITFAFGGSVGPTGRPGWTAFMIELNAAWVFDDPRFGDDPTGRETTGLGPRAEECMPIYEEIFAAYPADELVEMIQRRGGAAAEFLSYDDVVAHDQVRELSLLNDLAVGNGISRITSFPARYSEMSLR